MPVTQWLDDDVPIVDRDRWRLAVAGRPWSLAELDELVDEHGWSCSPRWTAPVAGTPTSAGRECSSTGSSLPPGPTEAAVWRYGR
jgi:hypothetical protein